MRFTPEEESKILSCLANGVPICCSNRHPPSDIVRDIVPLRLTFEAYGGNDIPGRSSYVADVLSKRSVLADFAHDGLGCTSPFPSPMWDHYFDVAVAWLSDQS